MSDPFTEQLPVSIIYRLGLCLGSSGGCPDDGGRRTLKLRYVFSGHSNSTNHINKGFGGGEVEEVILDPISQETSGWRHTR